jgi:HK97 family phage major capsid protein
MVYNANLPRGTSPTFTSGSNAANPLIPVEMQKEIMEAATEKSVVGRLARRVSMGTQLRDMPVFAALPTAYWVNGDFGLKQATTVAWKNVRLTAEEIAVLLPIPLNVVNDSSYKIWEQIRPKIEEAFAVALDAAVLFGTNKPTSWPTAIGPAAIAAGNTVTQGGGVDVAADLNNVLAAAEADGFNPNGFAIRQDLRASLRGLRDTTNGFIFKPGEPGAENSSFGRNAGSREGQIFDVRAISVLNGTFEAENTASANAVKAIAGDWDQVMPSSRTRLARLNTTRSSRTGSSGGSRRATPSRCRTRSTG